MKFWICTDSVRTALHSKRQTPGAQRGPRKTQGNIERLTRWSPTLAATLRGATVYVARPASFIPRLRSERQRTERLDVHSASKRSLHLKIQRLTRKIVLVSDTTQT